jgi:hypothetical protein
LTEICDSRIQELVSELELEIGPERRCVIDVECGGVRQREFWSSQLSDLRGESRYQTAG